ncbi:MAG TPA: DUF3048 domain-containing protein [Acidimicrobiia bacterium]|nr:DUF3048 domain-containing protein [Acidimicrobiia bacterium]
MTRAPATLAAALALVLAACSGTPDGSKDRTSPGPATETTTTTTTAETTTSTTDQADLTTVTTYPPEYSSPLNGLPAENPDDLDRGAIAVKVDNHPLARPQGEIGNADAMIETIVEGGFTRFIALFHDNESDFIGPIRSLRPTDTALAAGMGTPIGISGGQPWIQSIAVSRNVRLVGESRGFFRASGRTAPHNLFADTMSIRSTAIARGWSNERPTALFEIGVWHIPDDAASQIEMYWADSNVVRWVWDPEEKVYSRWLGDTPHEWARRDGTREQITAQVLIIVEGTQYVERNPAGTGSNVPAIDTLGSGQAWVFAVGRVWQGSWQRSAYGEPFTLLDADGTPTVVPTGIPWISVFPEQRTIEYLE